MTLVTVYSAAPPCQARCVWGGGAAAARLDKGPSIVMHAHRTPPHTSAAHERMRAQRNARNRMATAAPENRSRNMRTSPHTARCQPAGRPGPAPGRAPRQPQGTRHRDPPRLPKMTRKMARETARKRTRKRKGNGLRKWPG